MIALVQMLQQGACLPRNHPPGSGEDLRLITWLRVPVSLSCILRLQTWLWLTAVCSQANVASNDAIELRGTLTQQMFSPDSVWRQGFRIQRNADATEWCIESVTTPPRSAFYQSPNTIVTHSKILTATGKDHGEYVEISSLWEGFPLDLGAEYLQLWTAFCAGKYLHERHDQWLPIPYGDLRLDLFPLATRAKLTFLSDSNPYPARIDYLFDHSLLKEATKLLKLQSPGIYLDQRSETLRVLKQHYASARTAAVFQVTQWLNLKGHELPKEWTLEIYGINSACVCVVKWETESATWINGVTKPSIPQVAKVLDKRVRHVQKGVNDVSYTITNAVIPDLHSPTVMRLAVRAARDDVYTLPPARFTWIRGLLLMLLAGLLLAPFFWVKHRTNNI